MQYTATVKLGYTNLWSRAKVEPQRVATLKAICQRFIANRARYEAIEKATGVPWWWIACVHERESSCNFGTYLGNGEPLNQVTQLVPRGRGPFPSWEAGAIDALTFQGFAGLRDWSIPAALYRFEAYNGWGYVSKGVNSPYVWSFTDQYHGGKYVADGVFSPSTVDPQPGCAAMLNILLTLIPNLIATVIPPMTTPAPSAPPPAVPIGANSTAGLNTSNSAILSTAITSIIGSLFAVGSPAAILMNGTSWGHIVTAGLTLVAGLAAAAAPLANLLNHNAGAILNTVAASAGTVAHNVEVSTANPTNPPPA